MAKHDSVSSEDQPAREQKVETSVPELDEVVSSEAEGMPRRAEADGDLAEDGFDIETHGGGEMEALAGFQIARALTEGFRSEEIDVSEELSTLPSACDLEFEQPESVCGRDDRVRVSPATGIPWRLICQLIIKRADGGGSRCTGWFIGPRTVMTAGHCVFSRSAGGWARSIEVVPGMDSSSRPYGSQTGTSFRSVRGWTSNGDPEYDYGAIILPNNNLGNRVGWFGFAALSDSSLKNLLINNSGYPGDKPFATQWFNAGRITKTTARRLEYMVDTAGGQSGSPTWRLRSGKRHALGVHAYGGCPNKSTRITRPVFDNMMRWKNLGF